MDDDPNFGWLLASVKTGSFGKLGRESSDRLQQRQAL